MVRLKNIGICQKTINMYLQVQQWILLLIFQLAAADTTLNFANKFYSSNFSDINDGHFFKIFRE